MITSGNETLAEQTPASESAPTDRLPLPTESADEYDVSGDAANVASDSPDSDADDDSKSWTPAPLPTGSARQKVMMSVAVFLPLIGTVAAIVWAWQYGWMGWGYLAMMIGGWYLTGMGITIGFHRLLTHRSFESKPWVRMFWTFAGCLSIEGSPLLWCAIHRRHHQLSDLEGDPHSPHIHEGGMMGVLKGFYHAHTGWLFREYWDEPQYKRYVPDLLKDPIVMFADRYYGIFILATFALPMLIGGLVTMSWMGALLGLFWGGFARMLFTQHITWSINSFCHIFGKRDYESSDLSTNNVLFGVVAHGEGWHNNHHAFPTSARHGLKWWQFDASWVVIRALEMTGQVWAVKTPSARAMESKRIDPSKPRPRPTFVEPVRRNATEQAAEEVEHEHVAQ